MCCLVQNMGRCICIFGGSFLEGDLCLCVCNFLWMQWWTSSSGKGWLFLPPPTQVTVPLRPVRPPNPSLHYITCVKRMFLSKATISEFNHVIQTKTCKNHASTSTSSNMLNYFNYYISSHICMETLFQLVYIHENSHISLPSLCSVEFGIKSWILYHPNDTFQL